MDTIEFQKYMKTEVASNSFVEAFAADIVIVSICSHVTITSDISYTARLAVESCMYVSSFKCHRLQKWLVLTTRKIWCNW